MIENVTTEVLATPTDSVNVSNGLYTTSDIYILLYVFVLLVVAFLVKIMFRKMYVNILGGRKGE